MSVQIKEVKSKKDFKLFITLPWKLYSNDKNWVPPFRPSLEPLFKKSHPFHKTAEMKLYLALKDREIVGRIATILNHAYNEFHNEKTMCFGFFESINDQSVANELFQQVFQDAKTHSMEKILGPVHPSTNYESGLLVKGTEEPPYLMMPYNHSYYQTLIERSGLEKAKDLLAYRIDTNFKMPEKANMIAEKIEKEANITYRPVDKTKWQDELEIMYDIYNSAWEKNWGFIPMSKEEFEATANEMKMIAEENLILFAYVDGKPAGFIVTIPDYNQVFKKISNGKLFPTGIFKLLRAKKYINRVRTITLGIKPEYRKVGAATLLYRQSQIEALKLNRFKEAEMSWVLEDNLPMNKPLLEMGAEAYKTYRIYEKEVN